MLTSDDLWPKPKTIGTIYLLWMIHHPSMVIIGRCVIDLEWLQGFQYLTSVDHWPEPKTIGTIYSLWVIHHPSMRMIGCCLIDLEWLQGFQYLTSVDLRWPLTWTNNNRAHLLTMGIPPPKYEKHPTLRLPVIVFTRFSVFALWWPQMTFDLYQKQQKSSIHFE